MRYLLFIVAVLFGCKNTPEQLKDEGYINITTVESGTCPTEDPELFEAYRADRDSKTWNITVCCHHYWTVMLIGKSLHPVRERSCSRYTQELL